LRLFKCGYIVIVCNKVTIWTNQRTVQTVLNENHLKNCETIRAIKLLHLGDPS
jgi:hypothetical protein